MKKMLGVLLVSLALSVTACGGGGGGSSTVDNNGESSNGSNGSDSGSDLNSGGTGSSGPVSPSNLGGVQNEVEDTGGSTIGTGGGGSSSEDARFITYVNSSEDYGIWGCATLNSENVIYMLLWDTSDQGQIGKIWINPEDNPDPYDLTWDAAGGDLNLLSGKESLTFADYQFEDDYTWVATFKLGEFSDDTACFMFNQDGEYLGDLDPQDNGGGGTTETDPAEIFLTHYNDDTDFSQWGCFTQNSENLIAMILVEDEDSKYGAMRINDSDFFSIVWGADDTTLVVQESETSSAVFSDYSFSAANSWEATVTIGDFQDEVVCNLYDQSGNQL